MKIFNYILLQVICMLTLTACQTKNSSDFIVIGYDNTFVPMGYLNENQEVIGFDIDLATEVFNRLDQPIQFQSIDWSMKETELNAYNIDLIWNGYSLTDERKEKVAYSDAYLNNRQIIITLADSTIETKADLSHKQIGTQQGSASLEAIEKDADLNQLIANQAPILYENFDQAFRDLDAKRIDAIVVDEVLGRYFISKKQSTDYRILDEDLGEEVFVVGARKSDTDLIDSINVILSELKLDGTFDTIYEKWFGSSSDDL